MSKTFYDFIIDEICILKNSRCSFHSHDFFAAEIHRFTEALISVAENIRHLDHCSYAGSRFNAKYSRRVHDGCRLATPVGIKTRKWLKPAVARAGVCHPVMTDSCVHDGDTGYTPRQARARDDIVRTF